MPAKKKVTTTDATAEKRTFNKFCPTCDKTIQVSGGKVKTCPVCNTDFPKKEGTTSKGKASTVKADPMVKIGQIINLFKSHNIPASLTYDENGPKWIIGGKNSKVNWTLENDGTYGDNKAAVDMDPPVPTVTMSLVTAVKFIG